MKFKRSVTNNTIKANTPFHCLPGFAEEKRIALIGQESKLVWPICGTFTAISYQWQHNLPCHERMRGPLRSQSKRTTFAFTAHKRLARLSKPQKTQLSKSQMVSGTCDGLPTCPGCSLPDTETSPTKSCKNNRWFRKWLDGLRHMYDLMKLCLEFSRGEVLGGLKDTDPGL